MFTWSSRHVKNTLPVQESYIKLQVVAMLTLYYIIVNTTQSCNYHLTRERLILLHSIKLYAIEM